MDAMPRPRLPHVQREVSRHGRVMWFFRRKRGGPRRRLPDDYGSDEFMEAYNAALADKAAPERTKATSGTLSWLVEQYKRSAKWAGLAPSTQAARDRLMRGICDRAGEMPIRQITKRIVQQGVNDRAAKPEAANAFLKTMRSLLAHAVEMDILDRNPALDVKLIRVQTDGHHTWTPEELDAFEARWPVGTNARLAFDLVLYTGLRIGDLRHIGRQHIRDGILSIRPEKTRRSSNVVVTLHLPEQLLASIAAVQSDGLHLLITEYGKPFASGKSISAWFSERCKMAGVPGTAHGIRKAGATRDAERGATAHELMAKYGWVTMDEAERYTRAADRRRIGLAVSERLSRTS